MPAFTYNQLVQETMNRNGFSSRDAKQMATRVSNYLNKAAEALEKKDETKALAEDLRKFSAAVKAVSGPLNPRTRNQVMDGLKTLEGFSDFLEAEDASGVSNYEKMVNELEAGGTSANNIQGDLEYLSMQAGLELDIDSLEKQRGRRLQANAQNRPPQPQVQNPQPQAAPPQPAPEDLEDDIPGGALNIDAEREAMAAMPGPKEDEADFQAEEAEFNEIKVPGKEKPTVAEAYDYYYRERDFWVTGSDTPAMAVDENGKAWTDPEEIKSELAKPGRRLFVFPDDGSLPHALENRDGKLYASDGGICATNQLPGKELFDAKKSLKATDIAEIPSYKGIKATENRAKDYSLKIKVMNDKIDKVKTDLKEAHKWLEGGELSGKTMRRPKPPKTRSAVWRWTVKFFTIGFGETKTYKTYKSKVRAWQNRTKQAERQLKDLPKKIGELETKRNEYRQMKNAISEENAKLTAAYMKANPDAKKEEIKNYRLHTEVRMEGIADIIKNGRVTPENIFANTWLKKAACEGKTAADPEAVKNLKEYIISRTIEEEVLKQTIEDKEYAAARNERMTDIINNGSGMEKMKKDDIFKKLLQEQGDKPIRPETFFETYSVRSRERERERNHPLYKLEAEREAMIKDFGQKEISENCLKDVTRLNMLNRAIENAKKLPKDVDDIPEEQQKEFNRYLARIYKNQDVGESMKPASRNAIKTLSQADANKGKKYTLDQMTEMVNNQAKNNNGPQIQAGV